MPLQMPEWVSDMAGLPVLGDWMDSPECADLAQVIQQTFPWAPAGLLDRKNPRRDYSRAAQPLAGRLKDQVFALAAYAATAKPQQGESLMGTPPLPMLLAALAERLPMFDKVPQVSRYRRFSLGQLLVGIFLHPKGGAA